MFERRLKIVLCVLGCIVAVLLLRAGQVQLLAGGYWQEQAASALKHSELTETTRGAILDFKGREVAVDEGCIDLCVDYRAITVAPEEKWVRDVALIRLRRRPDNTYRSAPLVERRRMLQEEIAQVRTQIEIMWAKIARLSGKSPEEIDEVRQVIVRRVEMRARALAYRRFQLAMQRYEKRDPAPWYRQWIIGDGGDAPQLDSFVEAVAEQSEPHVVVRDYVDRNNELGKNIDKYPGLVLRAGKRRVYPYHEIGAHLMGHLSRVSKEDLKSDPDPDDELREYLPNDLIGRGGVEELCERELRGSRGRIERLANKDQILGRVEPVQGKNVKLTIDMDLQADVYNAFIKRREFRTYTGELDEVREKQHGAAVVIDVKTGELRALVSYPSFDINKLDELYPVLAQDDLNQPLLNRATQAQFPPGSTVKTMVGAGALTHGYIKPDETIECTGYLIIDGHRFADNFRCWVARQYAYLKINVAHHQVPSHAPHPTGFLTVTDALERSCNVVFETLANRMGLAEVVYWFGQFGLGRPTGVGIPEARGRLPVVGEMPGRLVKPITWSAGIGQGEVLATPLQMGNVAATIARNGIWLRPRIVSANSGQPAVGGGQSNPKPDRVDLKLAPEALAAVKEGMKRVVNSPAGTIDPSHNRMLGGMVAAKTGSAQVGKLSVFKRDANGQFIIEDGRKVRQPVELGTPGTEMWYVGVGPEKNQTVHAWVIGYAPADNPQVAFCVMVEYGGSGGRVAADIAQDLLDACIEHGYLAPPK